MKYTAIFFISLFLGTVFAQNTKNIPDVLQNKLKTLYPKAEEIKWDKEDADFEASFEVNDVEMSVLFDTKGTVLEAETEIENLPPMVKNSLNKDFPGYDVKETARIVKNGQTTYEAEIEKGETKLDAIYSPDGKLLKKIKKQEKGEEPEKAENGEKEENKENEHER